MRLKVDHVRAAAPHRPAGYLEEVLASGTLDPSGEWLTLPDDAYRDLVARYRPTLSSQAATVLRAGCRWLATGLQLTGEDLWFARSCVCALCPAWDARHTRCLQCGCTSLKHHMPSECCPLGYW